MNELLEGIAAAASTHVETTFADDRFPDSDPDTAYVFIPHEFFDTVDKFRWPDHQQAKRTIAFCVEMPGTFWFEKTSGYAGRAGAIVAMNQSAVAELRRRGLPAEHMQLGYVPEWDCWKGDHTRDRPIDALYMGSTDLRRDALLAAYSEDLWPYRSSILLPPIDPRFHARLDYLMGNDKYERMASSKVLINLHRDQSQSFEWARAMEAISNGCVVASERSLDDEPLVAGEHLLVSSPENLGILVARLLEDPDAQSRMRDAAYDFVRTELPMSRTVTRLVEIATGLVEGRARPADDGFATIPSPPPWDDPPVRVEEAKRVQRHAERSREIERVEAGLGVVASRVLELRRLVEGLLPPDDAFDDSSVRVVAETDAFASCTPRVSIVVPLFNHSLEVVECLDSVRASLFDDYEVLVFDDGSVDPSAATVERYFEEHPELPAKLWQGRFNRGPSRARNALVAEARGELLFLLDSDNKVYPTMIGRLVEALDDAPDASFAYAMLAEFREGKPHALRSVGPWDPDRLRRGNYIDVMSLVRRAELDEIGGFWEDPRLLGWEDYDLWCRFADAGRSAVLVPEILGWYRAAGHSRDAAFIAIGPTTAVSLITARAPSFFGTERPDLSAAS